VHDALALEQLEMSAVHLEECAALVNRGSVAHLRIALILVDNAVEVVMNRKIAQLMAYNHIETITDFLRQLRSGHDPVSKKRRDKIDRSFPAKVEFLLERGGIDEPTALSVNKLHDYCNEVQHRDVLRKDVLKPAVRVYFELACQMLATYEPQVLFHRAFFTLEEHIAWIEANYPTVAKYQRLSILHSSTGGGSSVAFAIYDQIEEGMDFESIQNDLISYLTRRIDQIDTALGRGLELMYAEGGLDKDLLIRFAQVSDEDSGALVDLRRRNFKYQYIDLERWRGEVDALKNAIERSKLFAQFARIEDDLQPCWSQVTEMVDAFEQMWEEDENIRRMK
jgi:hypothetical protein